MSKLHKHPRVLPAKMETEREKYDAYEWCKSELRRTREAGEYDGDPEQWHPAARLTRLAEDPTSTCRARALDSHPGLLQRRSFHCRTWGPPYIGTPVEPKNLHRDFVRVLKVAEVPRIRFHDLRHSAASLLLAQGVPLRMIMEQLGHSSIALTANTYAHVMPSAMREVADKMEAIIGG